MGARLAPRGLLVFDANTLRTYRTAFSERGIATELTMNAVFKTKEQFDEVVERYGAIEGGKQHIGRLMSYIATLVAARTVG